MPVEKEKRLPVSVSGAVFIEDNQGRLLLLQQGAEGKGNKWGPPAGGMLAHEDPIDVTLRETREEIGLDVELVDIVGIYTADRGDSESGLGFVFRAKIAKGEIKPRGGEIKDYRFFSSQEIDELIEKGLIYKPEYNLQAFQDWLAGNFYPLGVIKRLKR